jgi:hypothetical protein
MTPEQYQQYLRQVATPIVSYTGENIDRAMPGWTLNQDGRNYSPNLTPEATAYGYTLDNFMANPDAYVSSLRQFDYIPEAHQEDGKASMYNGRPYEDVDRNGNLVGSGTLSSFNDEGGALRNFIIGASMMLPAFGATIMGAGAAAGAGSTGAGFVGEGAASGIPAWDGAASTALSGSYGPAGLATAGGAGAAGAGGATTAMGAGAGATTAATTGGSTLSSLLPSGVSSYLGPAATIIGGLLGSQGRESSQTTARDIPEWLKPYVLGNQGLLAQAAQRYQASQSPENQQMQQALRNQTMGLLSRPIAGNPRG